MAVSRLLRLGTGQGQAPNITAERLRPHLLHYLAEADQIQQANLPRPYRRALFHSLEELNGLYDYWVGAKGMPPWAFDGVVASKSTDINARMQMLYEQYGSDIPYFKYLAPPYSLQAPLRVDGQEDGDAVTLLDFQAAPEETQPEEAHINHQTLIERFRNLSDMFRHLRSDDALAVVVVFDLPFTGHAEINRTELAARLRLREQDLRPYVEQQILPALKEIADRIGLNYHDL